MISDTQVVFRGIDHSAAVEEAVHKRVEKLERFCDEIHSLRVILESPHNYHHKGRVYHVGVEALIPSHEIVVTRDQHDNHSHEDIYVAIRDAFNALERRLKSVYAKQRSNDRQAKKLGETLSVMPLAGGLESNVTEMNASDTNTFKANTFETDSREIANA